jgi:hypothetical protein
MQYKNDLTRVQQIKGKIKDTNYGKRSELRISQRRKPKRTSKKLETITTLKRFIKVIRTSKFKKIRTSKVTYLWRFAFVT